MPDQVRARVAGVVDIVVARTVVCGFYRNECCCHGCGVGAVAIVVRVAVCVCLCGWLFCGPGGGERDVGCCCP